MYKFKHIKENLSLQQIRSKDVYSKNAHVNKFYNNRKSLIGNPNKNVKFIDLDSIFMATEDPDLNKYLEIKKNEIILKD